MIKKIIITLGVLVGFLCICVFSIPFMFFLNNFLGALTPPPNLKRYVTEDELIGIWVHTPGTEKIITRDKPSDTRPIKCQLILRRDGTCEFDSVYGNYDSFAYRKSSGSWTLEHDTLGNSNRRKKNAIAFDMKEPGFAGNMYLNLKERNGKLLLWDWHNDPDSGEFIEYMKEEKEKEE